MKESHVTYQHTQIGRLLIFTFIAVALLFWTILKEAGYEPYLTMLMGIILLILLSIASLNVLIDPKYIRIKFGYGIFRKKFALSEISSVKAVRNHWYYGWGIRIWFWPRMLIFNVSGFDAVELKMKNGKVYRIGTDEPAELTRAVSEALIKKHEAR